MAKFKPGFWYKTRESKTNWVSFNTYAELKRNLKGYLEQTTESHIAVFRSRRGEWGEWFEHWELCSNGKPRIIKEGWN
jgi:hypothetical protein